MEKFLEIVAKEIYNSNQNLDEIFIVFPNKRSSVYFQRELSNIIKTPLWLPKLFSIEDFLIEISNYKLIDDTLLKYEFFKIFNTKSKKNTFKSFDNYIKWSNIIINDFNDIYKNISSPKKLFNYLENLSSFEESEKDNSIKSTLTNLLKELPSVFPEFHKYLLNEKKCTSGMLYSLAYENLESWVIKNNIKSKSIYYVGFNAMSYFETKIFRWFIKKNYCIALWDSDDYFVNIKNFEAGKFLKSHKDWFNKNHIDFQFENSDFEKFKEILITPARNEVNQIQIAAEILNDNLNKFSPSEIALILPDESLLAPLLSFLPERAKNINISFGKKLSDSIYFTFLNFLFEFYLSHRDLNYSYINKSDIIKLLSINIFNNTHLFTKMLNLREEISKIDNKYISGKTLLKNTDPRIKNLILKILSYDVKNVVNLLKVLLDIIKQIINFVDDKSKVYELILFKKVFTKFLELEYTFNFSKTTTSIKIMFNSSCKKTYLAPNKYNSSSSNVLGFLETRNLDFENVIILSLNEGVVPKKIINHSILPYDIRNNFNMNMELEYDSIYSYHFYRLIKRSKKVNLLYNEGLGGFMGGEKSRFIYQIKELFTKKNLGKIKLYKQNFKIPKKTTENISIEKDNYVISKIQNIISDKGFSASSLNLYKKCPIRFYYEKILKIPETKYNNGEITPDIFGTAIHNALHDFLEPFKKKKLQAKNFDEIYPKIEQKIKNIYKETLMKDTSKIGKNILTESISINLIKRYFDFEKKNAINNNIEIYDLEKELFHNIKYGKTNIKLVGKIDRIQSLNGQTQILDYKTGSVKASDLKISDIELLVFDPKYQTAFQLFFYYYLYKKNNLAKEGLSSGVVSLRNLKSGFQPIIIDGQKIINENLIDEFEKHLINLILEIKDTKYPFTHINKKEECIFCDNI